MKEFSQATKKDFEELDQILSDGQLHVYYNRELPKNCTPNRARIGFEKEDDLYTLYIDRGIQTSIKNCPFSLWIDKGETRFAGLDDLIDFFRSVFPLFNENITPCNCDEETNGVIAEKRQDRKLSVKSDVVDRKKLDNIKKEREQIKDVWPEEISYELKKEIYGQDLAIDSLSNGIVINQMRNQDKVYVALFLGPPASGKTETGTILAKVLTKLYGRDYGFLKIDCNIYRQEHMIHNIIGSPPSYVGADKGSVLDPIRKNPYHVILFDEIEKAHNNLLVVLMEALETGYLSLADNSPKINLNRCIILFTSNIPVNIDIYKSYSDYQKTEFCKDIFTKHCGKPEISRRIKDFMVFTPLSDDAKVEIIIKFAEKVLENYGADLIRIDEYLLLDFLKDETKYGASEIANRVEKAIGQAMIKSHDRYLISGKKVFVKGTPENINLEIMEEKN